MQSKKGNFKAMLDAVKVRGFTPKKLDDYTWSINGRKFEWPVFLKECQRIIRVYPVIK